MAIVWIMFATMYYLSLLPRLGRPLGHAQERAICRSLLGDSGILYSRASGGCFYLVLLAYFVKIGISMKWPTGQLGPMILSYSGLIIYVLASRWKTALQFCINAFF